MKNFDLTKDKITSFAAAVMQVKDTREDVDFQQGHMTLTLKLTAQVDLAEVRKQLAARQADASVWGDVAVQNERPKRLEAQFELMQQQQVGQAHMRTPAPPISDISTADVHWLRTQATQGNVKTQAYLGMLYSKGHGVPRDFAMARQWWEKAAAQGGKSAEHAQWNLGRLYAEGKGVPQNYTQAAKWYENAAAQVNAVAQSI